jgi:hypothetical protein
MKQNFFATEAQRTRRGMLQLFSLCVLCLCGISFAALAQSNTPTSVPFAWALNTYAGTMLATSTANATNNTNGAAFPSPTAKQHTFQMVITNATGTNASIYLDRSLDAVNWTPFFTNTSSSTATNDFVLAGKWYFFRARFTGTNASAVVSYFGGN